MKLLGFLLINILFVFRFTECINLFYLDRNCGKTLDLDDSFRLQVTSKGNLPANFNCTVDISAKSTIIGGQSRVLARFININMAPATSGSCQRSKLDIYEGIRNQTLISPPTGLCGNTLASYSYFTSTDSFMTITVSTNASPQLGNFDMVITNFHQLTEGETCLSGFWECGNKRCVKSSLKCNKFDNCGDSSDETYEKCHPTMYFYEHCDQEIHVYDAVHLKLKRERTELIPNFKCTNNVVAHGSSTSIGGEARILAHFRVLNLQQPVSGNCTVARIDIYDGVRNKILLSDSTGICGTTAGKDYMTINDQFMPIELSADSSNQPGDFEITLTAFHEGDCLAGEFRCNNGRCVDTSVRCDGYSNCGDNSDNDNDFCTALGLAAGAIAAIVLSVLFLVICVPITCIIVIGRSRRRSSYAGI